MGIVFLEIAAAGEKPMLGGFLIIDRKRKRVHVRVRQKWPRRIKGDVLAVLRGMAASIEAVLEAEGIEKGLETIGGWSHLVRPTNELALARSVEAETLAHGLAQQFFQ